MKKLSSIFLLTASLTSFAPSSHAQYSTVMSENTAKKINRIIENTIKPNTALPQDELIERVSAQFLNTPYLADTLIGGPDQSEVLVVNFDAVDCFTYLDYVIALIKSTDASNYLESLINIRYEDSNVAYYSRKHFFTDWVARSPQNAVDVTSTLSPNAITVDKQLNQQANGDEYIKGLGTIPRTITYIPGGAIDQDVMDNIQQGDLVGIYTPLSGLDVTHTGFAIRKNGELFYRNASSLQINNKVVDTPFLEYMYSKPGIIVLRTLDN